MYDKMHDYNFWLNFIELNLSNFVNKKFIDNLILYNNKNILTKIINSWIQKKIF